MRCLLPASRPSSNIFMRSAPPSPTRSSSKSCSRMRSRLLRCVRSLMAQSDLTGRSLVEDESILAFADRCRVVLSDMNGVFAVAEGDRVVRARENSVVAVAKDDSVAGRSGHRADAVRIARSGPAQADGIV